MNILILMIVNNRKWERKIYMKIQALKNLKKWKLRYIQKSIQC